MNCIFNHKIDSIEDDEYERCNFLFYHQDKNSFTPIKYDKHNKKTIILVNEDNSENLKFAF